MKRILFSTLLVLGLQNSPEKFDEFIASTIGNKVDDEGKSDEKIETKKKETYSFFSLENESISIPNPKTSLIPILNRQITILKRKKPFKTKHKFTGLKLSQEELRKKMLKTAQKLKIWNQEGDFSTFFEEFDLFKINGFDQKGNIEFTAYYTPIFTVQHSEDEVYRYPIVKIESAKDTITNKRITTTIWAKNEKTAASVRMQGSAFVQYPDGSQELISYQPQVIQHAALPAGDTATHRNVFLAYTGFPKGSTGVPLTPEYSIAVDPRYIPYGSCLLSGVPIIDSRGKFIRHEYKLLFAQDTGSFIKGMHIDYYCGTGDAALKKARYMKHYGKMWLVLAKEDKQVEP
ncbi:MAG: membrane-bound lytic murein transglycosylase A [Saprospiraceae bacterium]|jgi:membrane-bound lytic murein transglycosylase A